MLLVQEVALFSCAVLDTYSPPGEIIAARINAPGSWHDSRVANTIYERLHTCTPPGFYLVADTAFPRGPNIINEKIQAPLKSGQ